MIRHNIAIIFALITIGLLTGCAEGPLWRMGKYTPWAQNQWAEEEKIANTLFAQKKDMTVKVDAAVGAPVEQQQEVAFELSEIASRNSVLLLRLHAVNQLGRLKSPAAVELWPMRLKTVIPMCVWQLLKPSKNYQPVLRFRICNN